MLELAAVMLLRCGGAEVDAASVKALLAKVEITGEDEKLDALMGDCKELDFEAQTTKGLEELEVLANIGGGPSCSGGAASGGDGAAAVAEVEEEEEVPKIRIFRHDKFFSLFNCNIIALVALRWLYVSKNSLE